MKHLLGLIFILSLLVACEQSAPDIFVADAPLKTETNTGNNALFDAYKNKKSDIFVEG